MISHFKSPLHPGRMPSTSMISFLLPTPLEKNGGHFSPGGTFFSQMYNEKIFKDSMAPEP